MDEIRRKLEEKEKFLLKMKQKIEEQLPSLPEGRLKIRLRKGKPEYYIVKDEQEKYISKDKIELISGLAQKSYLNNLRTNILEQMEIIKQFLKKYSFAAVTASYQQLSNERKQLVTPIYLTDEQYVQKWQNTPYTGKGFALNDTEIFTEKGERVRSKSEKMIADKLFMMGIPYKYECPVYLKTFGTVYPDFTILNIRNREEKYIEHFGMMDNPEYASAACQKISTYIKNGYYPGHNLILTFETSKKPLDIREIEACIRQNCELY